MLRRGSADVFLCNVTRETGGEAQNYEAQNYEGSVYLQWLLSLDIYLTLQSKTHWVDRTGHW